MVAERPHRRHGMGACELGIAFDYIHHMGPVDVVIVYLAAVCRKFQGMRIVSSEIEGHPVGIVEKHSVGIAFAKTDVEGDVAVKGVGVALVSIGIGTPEFEFPSPQVEVRSLVAESVEVFTVLNPFGAGNFLATMILVFFPAGTG